MVMAQILDQISFEKSTESFSKTPLQNLWVSGKVSQLYEGILALTAPQKTVLFSKLSENSVQRFVSLSQEKNSELFWGRLHAFAQEQWRDHRYEVAAVMFGFIQNSHTQSEVGPASLQLRQKAQASLNLLQGRGSLVENLEFLGRRVLHETFEPVGMLGMTTGIFSYGIARNFILSPLLSSPIGNQFTRGLMARLLGGIGGTFVEVSVFWGTTKGMREILSPGTQKWDATTNAHEMLGLGVTLSLLKGFGFGTLREVRKILQSEATVTSSIQKKFHHAALKTLPAAGGFTGIYLGRSLEEWFQLRTPSDPLIRGVDSLATLFQFKLAGQALPYLWGRDLQKFHHSIEQRLLQLEASVNFSSPFGPLKGLQSLQLAPANSLMSAGEKRLTVMESRSLPGGGGERGISSKNLLIQNFLQEVVQKGKVGDLEALKDILKKALVQPEVQDLQKYLLLRFESKDPAEWKSGFDLLKEKVQSGSRLSDFLIQYTPLQDYITQWNLRPHFTSSAQVSVVYSPGLSKAHRHFQNISGFRKAVSDHPDLKNISEWISQKKSAGIISAVVILKLETGDSFFFFNLKNTGVELHFNEKGIISLPIKIRNPFSTDELRIIENASPDLRSALLLQQLTNSFNPKKGETPSEWAMRLIEAGRNPDNEHGTALDIIRMLEARLQNPEEEPLVREAIERMVSLTSDTAEGSSIVARRYSIPGIKDIITIVSPPSTFLPEVWSQVFAEGLVSISQRKEAPGGKGIELGFGTGFISILLKKIGMVEEVIATDYNTRAAAVGKLNALLNRVHGIKFVTGDLFSNIPKEDLADVIVACIPQVPQDGPIKTQRGLADYYPSEGTLMDQYGLGLMARALREGKNYLQPGGKVFFNLAERPKLKVLEDLFHRAGYLPKVRYAQLVPQDTGTDITPFVEQEQKHHLKFQFYLKGNLDQPISATEALGQKNVFHKLNFMEGRRYSDLLHQAAVEVIPSVSRWGYTVDPGSEHDNVRKTLANELSGQWGAKIDPHSLFIAPSSGHLLEGLLRLTVPANGRVLSAGVSQELVTGVLEKTPLIKVSQVDLDYGKLIERIQTEKIDGIVLRLPNQIWKNQKGLEEFLIVARSNRVPLFFLQDQPAVLKAFELVKNHFSIYPERLENTFFIQSLSQTYQTSEYPLAVGIFSNASIFKLLERYAELTWSRVSAPIQVAYHRMMEGIQSERLKIEALNGEISPVFSNDPQPTLTGRILKSPETFDSMPHGNHPNVINMQFGESEYQPKVVLTPAVLQRVKLPYAQHYAETVHSVVKYLEETRGLKLTPDQIVLGNGVQPLITHTIVALRQMYEDLPLRVTVPQPSYGLFYATAQIALGQLHEIHTHLNNRYLVHPHFLEYEWNQNFAPQKKLQALLINEPSNPAGQYYSKDKLQGIAETVRRNDGFLLFDDLFGMLHFGRRGNEKRIPSLQILQNALGERMLGFGGLSKEFSAGGIRLGFAFSENQEILRRLQGDSLLKPDPIAMLAAQQYFENWRTLIPEHNAYLAGKAIHLENFFTDHGLHVLEVQGGYSLVVDLSSLYGKHYRPNGRQGPQVTAKNLHELLLTEAGLKVRSPEFNRLPGHYRFVFSIDRLEEAVVRLGRFFRYLR